jgi:hypothetical protein
LKFVGSVARYYIRGLGEDPAAADSTELAGFMWGFDGRHYGDGALGLYHLDTRDMDRLIAAGSPHGLMSQANLEAKAVAVPR